MTDTRLTARHCASPQVEISVIECVCMYVRIKNSADSDSFSVMFAVWTKENVDPCEACVQRVCGFT